MPISEATLREVFSGQIAEVRFAQWSRRKGRVEARIEERLGAISLSSKHWTNAPQDQVSSAMLEGVRHLGLALSDNANRYRARVELARDAGHDLPAMNDDDLINTLEDWLLPHIAGLRTTADWKRFDSLPALRAMLDWTQTQTLDREVPAAFETPLGRKIAIDYSGKDPEVSLRLQEMFGVTRHPVVAGRPLRVTLLSPAGRPVQTTTDLPGFWASSYADVRKDMRGRYPKHPWPEDPTVANPTLRAKPRGG